MTAEEIFEKSVAVMRRLLTPEGVRQAIKRARERNEAGNTGLLHREREHINELVRKIADDGGSVRALESVSQEVRDAMVIRYLRNREMFVKTFPGGIEGIDPDPVSIWAAIMISPRDEGWPDAPKY